MTLTNEAWEIIQEVLPGYSKEEQNYIAWEFTGYPEFWNTDDWKTEFRLQLIDFKNNTVEGC